ncbi:MAG: hypothetical protein OEN02_06140 [Gammaproteobacteria bacterium]|nr:hypothetical protein [Gammaproteobacteria bacterium]MDH3534131.1 hypothetical protein [Gammaproteobacteria bacterium]
MEWIYLRPRAGVMAAALSRNPIQDAIDCFDGNITGKVIMFNSK